LSYKIKDSIQGGFVRLNKVTDKVPCANCGNYLIFCNNREVVLIKTYATIFDIENREFVIKCGKCLQFNVIKLSDLEAGRKVLKLII
jgi:hypothetical protein